MELGSIWRLKLSRSPKPFGFVAPKTSLADRHSRQQRVSNSYVKAKIRIALRIASNPCPTRIVHPYSPLNQFPQLQEPALPGIAQINRVEIGWFYSGRDRRRGN
jgi:hypothetical protein